MNPSKMRNTYGKLMFIMQDSDIQSIRNETKLSLVKNILMVYTFLEERNSLDLLSDPSIIVATHCIDTILNTNITRDNINDFYRMKELAAKDLCKKYATGKYIYKLFLCCLYNVDNNI